MRKTVLITGASSGIGKETAYEYAKVFEGMPTSKDLAVFIYKSMKKGKTNVIHGFKNNFLTFIGRFRSKKDAHIY